MKSRSAVWRVPPSDPASSAVASCVSNRSGDVNRWFHVIWSHSRRDRRAQPGIDGLTEDAAEPVDDPDVALEKALSGQKKLKCADCAPK